jgi:hypothetical protein
MEKTWQWWTWPLSELYADIYLDENYNPRTRFSLPFPECKSVLLAGTNPPDYLYYTDECRYQCGVQ